jgi:hypothetical protein
MDSEIAIKIAIIPIKPKSSGVSNRASIIPTTKTIPCLAKLSMELQRTPEMVFCFSDIYWLNIPG